jgi:hypothetical protein
MKTLSTFAKIAISTSCLLALLVTTAHEKNTTVTAEINPPDAISNTTQVAEINPPDGSPSVA